MKSIVPAVALLTTAAVVSAEDAIEYWTEYAILPKRCIRYNDQDHVMYSMYEQSSNHCTDSPMGTYIAPVPTFVEAYLNQQSANALDEGEDFAWPAASTYLECYASQIDGIDVYLQLGCGDGSSSSLAVNIYDDEYCTQESEDVNGEDDSNVELDFEVKFQKCTPCVIWMDKNDDEIDDQYYVNKQTNAPLCSAMWEYREECNGKCQMMGREAREREGWNHADKVLLSILSFFGFGMLLAIINKRKKMSNKDALLEQAAISAAGLQQSHILGIFFLLVLVITTFALLGLKKITWALLLILNIVLFSYLMKLTVDGSVKETVIGPDGKVVEKDVDSDDDEEEDDDEDDGEDPASPAKGGGAGGTYENPELPKIT
ncbi:hypothetical protein ACHAWF_012394 [Thalassiosira exigua]